MIHQINDANRLPDESFVDRSWRGYDLRAAAPRFLLALALSALLLAGRWSFDNYTAAIVPYVIVLALWPGLLAAPLYRAITYTYRITDRALLVDRGFLNPPQPVIGFKEITSAHHRANWLDRRLGIGWVAVHCANGKNCKLSGLRHPAEFEADLIHAMHGFPGEMRNAEDGTRNA